MTVTLSALSGIVLTYMLIFCRIGAMVMLMPLIGDSSVPTRVRLLFAIGLSMAFAPTVASAYPQTAPLTVAALVVMIFKEILVGAVLGAMARLLTSALSVAGFFISNQIGMAMAQTLDPTSTNDQGALMGNFLSMLGIVAIFATNLHYLVINAVGSSYHLIPPGAVIPTNDLAELAVRYIADAFTLGFQLAAPFIVFGLVVNLSFGVLSRLMPQLQIFFVVMPINVILGLSLLAMIVGTMMTVYLDFFSSHMRMLQ